MRAGLQLSRGSQAGRRAPATHSVSSLAIWLHDAGRLPDSWLPSAHRPFRLTRAPHWGGSASVRPLTRKLLRGQRVAAGAGRAQLALHMPGHMALPHSSGQQSRPAAATHSVSSLVMAAQVAGSVPERSLEPRSLQASSSARRRYTAAGSLASHWHAWQAARWQLGCGSASSAAANGPPPCEASVPGRHGSAHVGSKLWCAHVLHGPQLGVGVRQLAAELISVQVPGPGRSSIPQQVARWQLDCGEQQAGTCMSLALLQSARVAEGTLLAQAACLPASTHR
jgi:hypothetical protein